MIVVADATAGLVIQIDPLTGAQTILSSGGSLVAPFGIAVDGNGMILVFDQGASSLKGAVFRIDPGTGVQYTVSTGGSFVDPFDVAVIPDDFPQDPPTPPDPGDILATDFSAFGGPGGVIQVSSATGKQTTLSSGGIFEDPFGIAIEADGHRGCDRGESVHPCRRSGREGDAARRPIDGDPVNGLVGGEPRSTRGPCDRRKRRRPRGGSERLRW
jgi:hypothetical protein